MSELYLPSGLVDELAAERAAELARLQDAPISFHDNQIRLATLSGASGHPSEMSALLREVRGWVAIGAGAVADRISGLALGAYARGKDDEDDEALGADHISNVILTSPNPVFSMQAILGLTAWWLNLTGQAYYQIVPDGAGIPRELWPMPPNRVHPIPSDADVIGGYVVSGSSGKEVFLETREVVRVWRPDPLDIYQSLGALSPQAVEYNAERFRITHVEQTYKNDATPRIVLEGDREEVLPTPGEHKAFGVKWREAYHRRKGQSQGVPAILPPGFTAHELGQTADGSMTVEMGNQLRDQMLSAMGVPGSIVGLVQDVNRAAAETNQYTFDKHGVMPKTKLVAAAMTQQLAPQFDPNILYKFEEFLAPDKEFLLRQEEMDLRQKVRVINEIRVRRKLEPVDHGEFPVGSFNEVPYTGDDRFGDDEFAGDLGITPGGNISTANTTTNAVTKASKAPNSTEKFNEAEAITASQVLNGAQVASIVEVAKAVHLNEIGFTAAVEILEVSFGIDNASAKKMLSTREGGVSRGVLGVTDAMRDAFSRERTWERMIANERKFTNKFMRAVAAVFQVQAEVVVERFRAANPVPRARVSLDGLFIEGEFSRLYSVTIEKLRELIYLENGQASNNIVSPGKEFTFLDAQRAALKKIHKDMAERVDRTTANRITGALVAGTNKGESIDQMAKRISGSIISRKRARVIARTEVGKASQIAQLDSFRQSDVIQRKQWNTSLDNFVRDSHAETQGQVKPLDELFELGSPGYNLADAPLDPGLPPEDLVNCRCFVTPVFINDGEN